MKRKMQTRFVYNLYHRRYMKGSDTGRGNHHMILESSVDERGYFNVLYIGRRIEGERVFSIWHYNQDGIMPVCSGGIGGSFVFVNGPNKGQLTQ